MEQFHVSQTKASLGLALYVLGYGIGPLLFSPLSEIPALGRNVPYLSSFFIFVIISVPTALVKNYPGLMILRFLQGFFGSPCLASGGASMADMYADIDIPMGLTGWVAAAYGGPALGTLLSAYSVPVKGWRWAMWEILWMSGPVLIIMLVFLPETSADNILLRRAQRIRRTTNNPNIRSHSEISQEHSTFWGLMGFSLVKPMEIMFKDPAILFTNIYTSLVYGIYYSFFESFPLVYPVIYGFSPGQSGLVFVSLAVACGIGIVAYITYLYTYMIPDLKKHGHRSQEHRLIPAVIASLFPPVGLSLFAWTSRESIHWIVGIIGILLYAAAVFIIFQCIFVYIPLVYPRYAASLFAGNDFSRSAFAFAFILFSRFIFVNLGIGKGVTVLAGLSVLGILGMVVLYFYGGKLRARSKFTETKDV
jgi:DHA1 family multidrug resistance protein-like MFS transporter